MKRREKSRKSAFLCWRVSVMRKWNNVKWVTLPLFFRYQFFDVIYVRVGFCVDVFKVVQKENPRDGLMSKPGHKWASSCFEAMQSGIRWAKTGGNVEIVLLGLCVSSLRVPESQPRVLNRLMTEPFYLFALNLNAHSREPNRAESGAMGASGQTRRSDVVAHELGHGIDR